MPKTEDSISEIINKIRWVEQFVIEGHNESDYYEALYKDDVLFPSNHGFKTPESLEIFLSKFRPYNIAPNLDAPINPFCRRTKDSSIYLCIGTAHYKKAALFIDDTLLAVSQGLWLFVALIISKYIRSITDLFPNNEYSRIRRPLAKKIVEVINETADDVPTLSHRLSSLLIDDIKRKLSPQLDTPTFSH